MSKSDLSGDLHLEVENYKGAAGRVKINICPSGIYLEVFQRDYEKDNSSNLLNEILDRRHVLLSSKECRIIVEHLIRSADILDKECKS